MSEHEVSLRSIDHRLDALTDLFRRRLAEDRTHAVVVEDLQQRLTRADEALGANAVRPVVEALALVIERSAGQPASEELLASITDELLYVLETLGVRVEHAVAGELVDPGSQQIVRVTGDGHELRVAHSLRPAYTRDGVVLRPAQVVAVRVGAGADAPLAAGDAPP